MTRRIYGTDVLVTGASSGIGKAIAIAFADKGYTVYGISRSIEEKTENIGRGKLIQLRADVTDRKSLQELKDKIPSLSIIIHAAGSGIAGRIPIPFQSHYSSSKYALEAYAEALRMEGRSHGIMSVLIEPGDTRTEFTSNRRIFIPKSSVYKTAAEKAIRRMENDEEKGKSPETVARMALRIAGRKNPPVRKPVGLGYSALMLLPRILPRKAVLWILGKMY